MATFPIFACFVPLKIYYQIVALADGNIVKYGINSRQGRFIHVIDRPDLHIIIATEL